MVGVGHLAASKGRSYEDLFEAKAWLLVRLLERCGVRLSAWRMIRIHKHLSLVYCKADCDAWTAQPPLVPDVLQVWLLRVEKYT